MNLNKQTEREGLSGKVMVVDDEPVTLKNLRHILEKAGYEVSTFTVILPVTTIPAEIVPEKGSLTR